jgi:hypothetical protein
MRGGLCRQAGTGSSCGPAKDFAVVLGEHEPVLGVISRNQLDQVLGRSGLGFALHVRRAVHEFALTANAWLGDREKSLAAGTDG